MPDASSVQGREIRVVKIGFGPTQILLVGGVHGDEIEGIETCERFISETNEVSAEWAKHVSVTVIPCLNPDGNASGQRSNANDVDLNRNLPTTNWRPEPTNPRYKPGAFPASEPETKRFLEIVKATAPVLIISAHSFTESLLLFPSNEVNAPFRPYVAVMSMALELPIVEKMNYEVFGSLSRWGMENGIATLTIELLRNAKSPNQVIKCVAEIILLIQRVGEASY